MWCISFWFSQLNIKNIRHQVYPVAVLDFYYMIVAVFLYICFFPLESWGVCFLTLLSNLYLNWCRPGSEEATYKLKQLGADEVFPESQLDMKNVKSLLVLLHYLPFQITRHPWPWQLVFSLLAYSSQKPMHGLVQIEIICLRQMKIVKTDYLPDLRRFEFEIEKCILN
jgi:hypothetical protein